MQRLMVSLALLGLWLSADWLTSSAVAVEEPDGRRLYMEYCAACHGKSGKGDGPDASHFVERPRNLREGFLRKYSTADLVRRIRDGRSLELALDLPALKARANDVESVVVHLKRLPTLNWRAIEPGWEAYVDRCEACHGLFGRPPQTRPQGVRRPRDLSDPGFQASMSDEELVTAVRHGRAHMPALVPRVSESEAAAITAYVRLLSPGYELYSQHCAACHGDDGRGVDFDSASMQLPAFAFDRAYFAKRDPEEIRSGVWHMLDAHKPIMPHFRWELSEAQARAIVKYLQQTEAPRK